MTQGNIPIYFLVVCYANELCAIQLVYNFVDGLGVVSLRTGLSTQSVDSLTGLITLSLPCCQAPC